MVFHIHFRSNKCVKKDITFILVLYMNGRESTSDTSSLALYANDIWRTQSLMATTDSVLTV